MSPFDPNYKPQIDAKPFRSSSLGSKHATEGRAAAMKSDDPAVRLQASGYIPGMSKTADPLNSDRIKRINSKV